MIKIIIISILLITTVSAAEPADSALYPNKVKVAAGDYSAGGLKTFFMGRLWREVWGTEVSVDIIDLNKFGSGLTAVEVGGGDQTRSILFKGEDGRQYKFRSVDKNLSKLVPEGAEGTLIMDLVQDHTAASFPYAPLIVSPLQEALSIYNVNPELYKLPDSGLEGEFKEFLGMLGTIEIHPEGEDEGTPFEGAEKVIGTFKFFKKLYEEKKHKVDAAEYLKIRLLDMIVGDWDRHTDQWRWGKFEVNGDEIWKPIPRDRDQAFSRYRGLIPKGVSLAYGHLTDFSAEEPDAGKLSISGRYVDRRILTSLTREEWDSVALYVKTNLTDSDITEAVKQLPQEIFEITGEELIEALKIRRAFIPVTAGKFYDLLFRFVDIYGGENNDIAEVTRGEDGSVEVTLLEENDEGEKKKHPYFNRKFYPDETEEIRLIMGEGDDKVIVKGETDKSILVKAAGGKGNDRYEDLSLVRNRFLGLFNRNEKLTGFYADKKDEEIITGKSSYVKKEKEEKEPETDEERWEPAQRTFGYSIDILPWLNISSDEGLFIGGGLGLNRYNFNAIPYQYRMEAFAGYSTKRRNFSFEYKARFTEAIDNGVIEMNLYLTRLEVLNFYGFGNETNERVSLLEEDFYKINQKQVIYNPLYETGFGDFVLRAGPEFKYVNTEQDENGLISTLSNQIIMNQWHFGAGLEGILGRVNHSLAPDSGYQIRLGGDYYFVNNVNSRFGRIKGEVRIYLPIIGNTLVLAVRGGGEKLWGDYPFYEAAFIGGRRSLRGEEYNRFAGDGSIYLNTDLRSWLFNSKIILPLRWGLIASADVARVFYKGERSEKWHNSFGGGILTRMLIPELTFSFTVMTGETRLQYYLSIGYLF
jgi:hypothetical protein